MAKTGYEIDESQWFREVGKLISLPEIWASVRWRFGYLFASASLLLVHGRRISLVLPQGPLEDLGKLSLVADIPILGARFLRKVDEGHHVLLCVHFEDDYICLADSLDILTFGDSEARVQ